MDTACALLCEIGAVRQTLRTFCRHVGSARKIRPRHTQTRTRAHPNTRKHTHAPRSTHPPSGTGRSRASSCTRAAGGALRRCSRTSSATCKHTRPPMWRRRLRLKRPAAPPPLRLLHLGGPPARRPCPVAHWAARWRSWCVRGGAVGGGVTIMRACAVWWWGAAAAPCRCAHAPTGHTRQQQQLPTYCRMAT